MKKLNGFEGEFRGVSYRYSRSHEIMHDLGDTTVEFKSISGPLVSAAFSITGYVAIDVLSHKKYKITIEEVE